MQLPTNTVVKCGLMLSLFGVLSLIFNPTRTRIGQSQIFRIVDGGLPYGVLAAPVGCPVLVEGVVSPAGCTWGDITHQAI